MNLVEGVLLLVFNLRKHQTVVHAGLELKVFLPHCPHGWDYRYAPSRLAII